MKKILIMGGTIFVSKYLATYFIAKGDDVYVYNRNTHKQPEKAMLIVGDRNNIGDSLKQYDFDLVIAVNTYTGDDMKELLSSLSTIKDIVFISSSAVYPETLPQPFKEEQLVGDNSIWGDYGSKKIGEIHSNRDNFRDMEYGGKKNIFDNIMGKLWMSQLIRELKKLSQTMRLNDRSIFSAPFLPPLMLRTRFMNNYAASQNATFTDTAFSLSVGMFFIRLRWKGL